MAKPGTPLHIPILLRYRDADGDVSERVVLVDTLEVEQENGVPTALTHLRGVCTMRRARRTFRADRILRAADPETGEIIENLPKWFAAALGRIQRDHTAPQVAPEAAARIATANAREVARIAARQTGTPTTATAFAQPAAATPQAQTAFINRTPTPPRPPPRAHWPRLGIALFVAVGFAVVWLASSLPTVAPPPSLPTPPPIPPRFALADIEANAHWLGFATGCLPLEADRELSATIQRGLDSSGPISHTARIAEAIADGRRRGTLELRDGLCERAITLAARLPRFPR